MAKSHTNAGISQQTRRSGNTIARSSKNDEKTKIESFVQEPQRVRRPLRIPSPAILLGFSVSTVMTLTGIAVIAGFLMNQGVPEKFRLTFGVVLTLMGVYRFVLTRMKQIQKLREEEDEE